GSLASLPFVLKCNLLCFRFSFSRQRLYLPDFGICRLCSILGFDPCSFSSSFPCFRLNQHRTSLHYLCVHRIVFCLVTVSVVKPALEVRSHHNKYPDKGNDRVDRTGLDFTIKRQLAILPKPADKIGH